MDDREITLANFQAATGVDNITYCIEVLEKNNWNLVQAISSYIPPNLAAQASGPYFSPTSTPSLARQGEPDRTPIVVQRDSLAATGDHLEGSFSTQTVAFGGLNNGMRGFQPVIADGSVGDSVLKPPPLNTGLPARRQIHLRIEWRDKTFPIIVNDDDVIERVKRSLEGHTGVPVEKQVLKGWPGHDDPPDMMLLSNMHLPKEVRLYLLSPPDYVDAASATVVASPPPLVIPPPIRVKISVEFNGTLTVIPIDSAKTLSEFKQDMYSLFHIEPRFQLWHGLPAGLDDKTQLQHCHLNQPVHLARLERLDHYSEQAPHSEDQLAPSCEAEANKSNAAEKEGTQRSSEEESDLEVPEFMDEGLDGEAVLERKQPLLPEESENTADALLHFTAQFQNRFGDPHPYFFLGSLNDAIKEALDCPVVDRKPLAIYVHHDLSIQSNVFCSQVLCAEPIVHYLSDNFILWAWDVTLTSNRKRLLSMISEYFGGVVSETVDKFEPDQLPILLIIVKSRSGLDVFSVLQGHISADELMMNLLTAVDAFHHTKELDLREETERLERQRMKDEQDAAYQASLAADKLKAEQRALEEREEQQRLLEKERNAQKKLQENAKHEAYLKELQDQLPEEPSREPGSRLATLRIRFPTGLTRTRRFLATDSLHMLLVFIESQGCPRSQYRVKVNFPRKEISALEDTMTLEEAGLCPQETLFVEEIVEEVV